MTLLLSPTASAARRAALADPQAIGGLAASLQRELHAALDVPVPDGKCRLTRHGGRCPQCTVLLAFDPRQPHAHTCPVCGAVCSDGVHHEWWLMNGHLWTAEQCTRASVLAWALDDSRAAARADDILATYADRYLRWPNRDNALGPTRPFFSTYLESIWLLHLCVALDLREQAGQTALSAGVRERLIAPSAALIASFPEGRSNREVWHVAARLAAARLLDDRGMRDVAAESLRTLLRTGLHTDGSWYEGENYHLFAHRGLLSAVTLAEQSGVEIPADLLARFEAGFAAPFRTMLPDGTFPSRRDSQYGISLRQYRTADWLECGLARRDTPELRAALAMMYDPSAPVGDSGRAFSTADAERNQPGVRLTRADCSWRTLLLGLTELPSLVNATPHSELLEGQGVAVFRRNGGRFWVGLDYGDPGAGHGHPDRLNLVIATDSHRWLDDVGTGSYTSPTLPWYRSSLAHNAPLVNGRDQGAARGTLLAHDDTPDAGWVRAAFTDPESGVRFERTVVVMQDHVLDELRWTSDSAVHVDVPLQAALRVPVGGFAETSIPSAPAALSDFITPQAAWLVDGGATVALALRGLPSPAVHAAHASGDFMTQCWSEESAVVWDASTIGPPAGAPHGLVALRQAGVRGRSVRLIAAADAGFALHADDTTLQVSHVTRGLTSHRATDAGWEITQPDHSRHVLRGVRAPREAIPTPAASTPDTTPRLSAPVDSVGQLVLGEPHYRGTEATWQEAGAPTATVWFSCHTDGVPRVVIGVGAHLGRPPRFAAACDLNPLDNELADVNSDGVQLHWRGPTGAWNSILAVPEGDRVRLSVEAGTLEELSAAWSPLDDGFQTVFTIPWADATRPLTFDVCVNECPPGRERRQGQLVLSGGNGESAYLRGARQDAARALTILFQHPPS